MQNKERQRPGAKATLYGLSSIRREGDVTVNMMSSHTTVKTKFTVGPLILKVEREVCMNHENKYTLKTYMLRKKLKINCVLIYIQTSSTEHTAWMSMPHKFLNQPFVYRISSQEER
jgi:hypothetical protein